MSESLVEHASQIDLWLSDPWVDPVDRKAVYEVAAAGDKDRIKACFSKNLDMGTAGFRAIVGPGYGRLNSCTLREIAEAAGRLILELTEESRIGQAAVSYDARSTSKPFADLVSAHLAQMGIDVLLTTTTQPTPILSYLTRTTQSDLGISITASHNPRAYNGCKIFDRRGVQITPPEEEKFLRHYEQVKGSRKERRSSGLRRDSAPGKIREVSPAILDSYLCDLDHLGILKRNRSSNESSSLKIVYSALHGVGGQGVLSCLKNAGFSKVFTVRAQHEPNGAFPTLKNLNPEHAETLSLALQKARRTSADIILATDPDADRAAAAVRHGGAFFALSGNQVGALMLGHLLSQNSRPRQSEPQRPEILAKSWVTSPMWDAIAGLHGVEVKQTPIGFRWVADCLLSRSENAANSFPLIFGGEESMGYLLTRLTGDKDGLAACAYLATVAAHFRSRNLTLIDGLEMLSRQLRAVYCNLSGSLKFSRGSMEGWIREIRRDPEEFFQIVRECLNDEIVATSGLRSGDLERDAGAEGPFKSGAVARPEDASLALLHLRSGGRVILRPSGTEPIGKIYIQLRRELAPKDAMMASHAALMRSAMAFFGLLSRHEAVARADLFTPELSELK